MGIFNFISNVDFWVYEYDSDKKDLNTSFPNSQNQNKKDLINNFSNPQKQNSFSSSVDFIPKKKPKVDLIIFTK